MFFQPTYPSSGLRGTNASSGSSGRNASSHPGQAAFPLKGTLTHAQTHSDWDNKDTTIHLLCTSLGCGKKPEYLKKTHTHMGRMCQLHTDGGPGQELIFFINLITKPD